MNTNTGELYELSRIASENVEAGQELGQAHFMALTDQLTEAKERAREALQRGDRIVAVNAPVVQKLRLGERELERRMRRRRSGSVAGS